MNHCGCLDTRVRVWPGDRVRENFGQTGVVVTTTHWCACGTELLICEDPRGVEFLTFSDCVRIIDNVWRLEPVWA